jgi:hypothetical protein
MSMTILIGAWAVANDAAPSALSVKRQMVVCMNKRMSADPVLSYNDARRDCKEAVAARNPVNTGKHSLTANAADARVLKSP